MSGACQVYWWSGVGILTPTAYCTDGPLLPLEVWLNNIKERSEFWTLLRNSTPYCGKLPHCRFLAARFRRDIYDMARTRRKDGLFTWDEAQCFVGADGHIATSYTNEHITITFMQDGNGTLVGIAYETETADATIDLIEDSNDD
jgi:hypothetical protein